jgi:hypothetical protein
VICHEKNNLKSGQVDAVATALTNDTVNILKFKANHGRKDINNYVKLFS